MKALVTAGSALTQIDTVRRVLSFDVDGSPEALSRLTHHEMQNIFKGELGTLIANELASRGIETTLLIMENSSVKTAIDPLVNVVRFKTFDQLATLLSTLLGEFKPDVVFMSAAPPDYAPEKVSGKMSSDPDTISIVYRKTPKLIDLLRRTLGEKAYLVGFKLLVGVTENQMRSVGFSQLARANTDLCVGNDLALIDQKTSLHPMHLMFEDGEEVFLDAKKISVTKSLVSLVVEKASTKFHSF